MRDELRHEPSCWSLRAERCQSVIDVVTARMPKAVPARCVEPSGDSGGGLRILTQQECLHGWIGNVRIVQKIEQFARDRAGRFSEAHKTINGFGKLRGAARSVAHLAGNKALIDGAGADDARECRRERARPRPVRIGAVEHDKIDRTAEEFRRGSETADEGDILRALEKVAAGIVTRMHENIGLRDALREATGCRARFTIRPAISV